MKTVKKIFAFIMAVTLMLSVLPAQNTFAATSVTVSGSYHQGEARKIWGMINSFRGSSSAWSWDSSNTQKVYFNSSAAQTNLYYDAGLERVAMQRAIEISVDFSHTRPNGSSCFSAYNELGVDYSAAGENIAYGYESAAAANKAWREDDEDYSGQGHRRNMLGESFNAVGIACVLVDGTYYWVEEFAYLDNARNNYGAANESSFSTSVSTDTNVSYTGLAKIYGEWYYLNKDDVDYSYTGLCQYFGNWFYVNKGIVDFGYTGLCRYGNAWYYIANGKLNWYATGLCKYNGNWFYVNNGKVDFGYTGLAKNAGHWFYIKNGVLDWNYTGLCKYNGSWFYVNKGILNWNYTGLCRYGNAWYYIANGKLNWYALGLCKYNGRWFYVNNGKVDFGYTGLARNAGNWFYIRNGVLNWNYSGSCPYNGHYYNVRNGIVVF